MVEKKYRLQGFKKKEDISTDRQRPDVEKQHTFKIYAQKSKRGHPTGHVWCSVSKPEGEEVHSHFSIEDKSGLKVFNSPGKIKIEISGEKAMGDLDPKPIEIPITEHQYYKVKAHIYEQAEELGETKGKSKDNYRILPFGQGKNCVKHTFDTAAAAGIEEAKEFKSVIPNAVAKKMETHHSKVKTDSKDHQLAKGFNLKETHNQTFEQRKCPPKEREDDSLQSAKHPIESKEVNSDQTIQKNRKR